MSASPSGRLAAAQWLDSFEMTVAIAELTNLELLKKGLYRVAISIRGGRNASVAACSASPSRLTSTSRAIHCDESDSGYEPQTVTADGTYLTRAVFCRYIDEAFDMTETATFVFDLEERAIAATPSGGIDADEGISVCFALLRAEYAVPQPEKGGKAGALAAGPIPGAPAADAAGRRRLTPFTEVSRREVPLARASLLGLQCYLPILWDSMNLAVAGVSLFCCQVGRRLSLPPPVAVPRTIPAAAAAAMQLSVDPPAAPSEPEAAAAASSSSGGGGGGTSFFGWAMRKIRQSAVAAAAASVFSDRSSESGPDGPLAPSASAGSGGAAMNEREAADLAVARYNATPLTPAEAQFPRWMAHCRQHAAAVRAASSSTPALNADCSSEFVMGASQLRLAAAVAGASSADDFSAATGAGKSPRGPRRSVPGLLPAAAAAAAAAGGSGSSRRASAGGSGSSRRASAGGSGSSRRASASSLSSSLRSGSSSRAGSFAAPSGGAAASGTAASAAIAAASPPPGLVTGRTRTRSGSGSVDATTATGMTVNVAGAAAVAVTATADATLSPPAFRLQLREVQSAHAAALLPLVRAYESLAGFLLTMIACLPDAERLLLLPPRRRCSTDSSSGTSSSSGPRAAIARDGRGAIGPSRSVSHGAPSAAAALFGFALPQSPASRAHRQAATEPKDKPEGACAAPHRYAFPVRRAAFLLGRVREAVAMAAERQSSLSVGVSGVDARAAALGSPSFLASNASRSYGQTDARASAGAAGAASARSVLELLREDLLRTLQFYTPPANRSDARSVVPGDGPTAASVGIGPTAAAAASIFGSSAAAAVSAPASITTARLDGVSARTCIIAASREWEFARTGRGEGSEASPAAAAAAAAATTQRLRRPSARVGSSVDASGPSAADASATIPTTPLRSAGEEALVSPSASSREATRGDGGLAAGAVIVAPGLPPLPPSSRARVAVLPAGAAGSANELVRDAFGFSLAACCQIAAAQDAATAASSVTDGPAPGASATAASSAEMLSPRTAVARAAASSSAGSLSEIAGIEPDVDSFPLRSDPSTPPPIRSRELRGDRTSDSDDSDAETPRRNAGAGSDAASALTAGGVQPLPDAASKCLPFAARAVACLHDPDAVAAGIQAEVEWLRRHIRRRLHLLSRILVQCRHTALLPLQALHRVCAFTELSARVKARRFPASCLQDPDSAGPLAVAAGLPRSLRRAQALPGFLLSSLPAPSVALTTAAASGGAALASVAALTVPQRRRGAGRNKSDLRGEHDDDDDDEAKVAAAEAAASEELFVSRVRQAGIGLVGGQSAAGPAFGGDADSDVSEGESTPVTLDSAGAHVDVGSGLALAGLVASRTLQCMELNPVEEPLLTLAKMISISESCFAPAGEGAEVGAASAAAAADRLQAVAAAAAASAVSAEIASEEHDRYSDDGDDDDEDASPRRDASVGADIASKAPSAAVDVHVIAHENAPRRSSEADDVHALADGLLDEAGISTRHRRADSPSTSASLGIGHAAGLAVSSSSARASDGAATPASEGGPSPAPSPKITPRAPHGSVVSPAAAAVACAGILQSTCQSAAARQLTPARRRPAKSSDAGAGASESGIASVAAAVAALGLPACPSDASPLPSTHVVVFLNGLGGSTHDTRLMRSYLKLLHPHLYCYVTTSNQAKETEGSLIEAADRVAKELSTLLNDRLPEEGLDVARLSFVTFSLGGLVARLALRHPLLRPFLPYCHAFVSVAAPHLGLLYATSSVVSAGIFLFRSWRNSDSLAQLSLSDEDTRGPEGIRNCLLYLLACGWDRDARKKVGPGGIAVPSAPAAAGVRQVDTGGVSAGENGKDKRGADGGGRGGTSTSTASSVSLLTHATLAVMERDPALAHRGHGVAGGSHLGSGDDPSDDFADSSGAPGGAAVDASSLVLSPSSPSPLPTSHESSGHGSVKDGAAAAADGSSSTGLIAGAVAASTGGGGAERRASLRLAAARSSMHSASRRIDVGAAAAAAAAAAGSASSAGAGHGAGPAAGPGAGSAPKRSIAPSLASSAPTASAASAALAAAAEVEHPVSATLAALRAKGFSSQPNGSLLCHFRHIVLLGSEQDAYAPAASCAATWCDAALRDATHGPAYGEMVRDFWSGVPPSRVTRWDVEFRQLSSLLQGRVTLDGVLGREAHIAFLETEHVAMALALRLAHVWDTSLFPRPAEVGGAGAGGGGGPGMLSSSDHDADDAEY